MKRITIASAALALVLSGCAGAVPWNNQGNAGLTDMHLEFSEDGKLKEARFISGREHDSVDITGDLKAGKFEYHAKGTKAFDGQKLRAAVEDAVSDDVKAAAPGIVDSVVGAVVKVMAP